MRFIQEAEVTVEQVVALINRLRAQGDVGDRRERRTATASCSPSPSAPARSRSHPARAAASTSRWPPAGIDRGRIAELCRAAKDRRWQSYRSIEHYAATSDRCRRRQLLDHFGDPTPGAPLGRCCDVHDPPDWLPPITAVKAKKKPPPVERRPARLGRRAASR